jgi:CheY-like chemotaxis protein
MNDGYAKENPAVESVGEREKKADGSTGRPVQDIKEEFGNTVEEIKDKFGLLLELRDRKIGQLEEKLATRRPQRTKSRILIVDDSQSTAEIVDRYLHGQPVELVSVTGSQALEHVHSQEYAAIMLEAASSIEADVNGISLCQELCEGGKAERVIVMSSRPGDKIKNLVEGAGAAFLRKPFSREHVVQLLRDVLHRNVE